MSALTRSSARCSALIALLTALAGVANYGALGRGAALRAGHGRARRPGVDRLLRHRAARRALRTRRSPGMMQSTLGNLPELFVVIFALQKGELLVAQTAIIGSIFANALLVLGLVIVVGARRAPRRRACASPSACRATRRRCCWWPSSSSSCSASRSPRRTAPATTSRRSRSWARCAARRLPGMGRSRICAPTKRPPDAADGAARRAAAAPRLSLGVTLALLGARRRRRGLRLGLVHQRARARRSPSCTSPRPSPGS